MNIICKNCGTVHASKYCHECGQKVITARLSTRQLFTSLVAGIFNLENGLWYTFYRLVQAPGDTVRDFLNGCTKRYYHPAKFALLTIAISTFVMVKMNVTRDSVGSFNDMAGINNAEGLAFQQTLMAFMEQYLQYFVILTIPLFAVVGRWFYHSFNFAEHLVIMAYATGMSATINMLAYIGHASFGLAMFLNHAISITYFIWMFYSLIRKRLFMHVIKGILIYVMGSVFFVIVFSILLMLFLIAYKTVVGSLEPLFIK